MTINCGYAFCSTNHGSIGAHQCVRNSEYLKFHSFVTVQDRRSHGYRWPALGNVATCCCGIWTVFFIGTRHSCTFAV